jgi:hypothetical protein
MRGATHTNAARARLLFRFSSREKISTFLRDISPANRRRAGDGFSAGHVRQTEGERGDGVDQQAAVASGQVPPQPCAHSGRPRPKLHTAAIRSTGSWQHCITCWFAPRRQPTGHPALRRCAPAIRFRRCISHVCANAQASGGPPYSISGRQRRTSAEVLVLRKT